MSIKFATWFPFLLAPVIGGVIGLQLFNSIHEEPVAIDDRPIPTIQQSSIPLLAELINLFDSKASVVENASDGEAAFMAALQEPVGPGRIKNLQAAYTGWVLQVPIQAIASIDRMRSDERQEIVAHALAILAQRRPEQFLNYVNGITHDYTTYMAAAMEVLAETNSGLALTLVHRNQDRADPHGVIIAALLPGLLRDDLALAVQTVTDMKDRASIAHIQQVATAYARQDSKQAYEWVYKILATRTDITPLQVLNDISGSLVASNPTEAANYLNRTSDPQIRKSLMGEISMQKGQQDLADAWTWLNQYKVDEHYGETALNLLYRWSYTKPAEVAKILPTVTDAQVQSAAVTHLSRFWQKKDPVGYQAWVASLPPGSMKNLATEPH